MEDNVQYLCPTFCEGPMKPVSFPRIGLLVSICIVLGVAFLGANQAAAQQAEGIQRQIAGK